MNWNSIEDLQRIMLTKSNKFGYKDPWFLREFLGLINTFQPTAFVETGTWKGGTVEFISIIYKNLPIYSCDIMPVDDVINYFKYSDLIHIYQRDSKSFLQAVNKSEIIGNLPFFFLDAHSAMDPTMEPQDINFNPLASELEEVVLCDKAIVCIHDFEVPGLPIFGHGSKFTLGGTKYQANINLQSIEKVLIGVKHNLWFPFFPSRLLFTDQINWTKLFDLRGRVYIIINPSDTDLGKMKVLEDFGILWKYGEVQ